MTGPWAAARSSRLVIAAVIAAAVAITAFSIAGVGILLGWIPRPAALTPSATASPGQQAAGTAPDVDVGPREGRVAPIESLGAEPLMPKYSAPTPPKAAPDAPVEAPPRREAPVTAAVRKPPAPPAPPREEEERHPTDTSPLPAPGPRAPAYARAGREPAEAPRPYARRGVCDTCGVVATITTYPGRWEVRVRFEDGEARVFRFRSRPPFGVGERVRFDDGFLVHD